MPDQNEPRPQGNDSTRNTEQERTGTKHVREDGAGVEDEVKRKQAVDPALMPGGDPAGAA
jgi:hypothetical protein